MKRFPLMALLSLFLSFSPPTLAQEPQLNELIRAAREQCKVSEKLHSYATQLLNRFARQFLIPGDPMLNTAFLRGFTWVASDNLGPGYCIVVFFGKKNDPYWEANSRFFHEAERLGALPKLVFSGINGSGAIQLSPLGAPAN